MKLRTYKGTVGGILLFLKLQDRRWNGVTNPCQTKHAATSKALKIYKSHDTLVLSIVHTVDIWHVQYVPEMITKF